MGDATSGLPSKDEFLDWLRRSFDACPECCEEVQVWERVCFGYDPHNTYHCYRCGWRGRKPAQGMRPSASPVVVEEAGP